MIPALDLRCRGRVLAFVSAPLLAASLAGCVSSSALSGVEKTVAAYPGSVLLPGHDGRARFREIYCGLVTSANGGDPAAQDCKDLLWRLADEPPAPGALRTPTPLSGTLRSFVVSGAFGDCFEEPTVPFGSGIDLLAAQGTSIQPLMVSGRSSAEANARTIAATLETAGISADDRLVLIGYSKGSIDILQFLVDYPGLAGQVAAVVSVAGPVQGSPLAARGDWLYRELFATSFAGRCDPGDGGVISSLLPEVRKKWLADHPLPSHIAYFSLAAFTSSEHISRGLKLPWDILAETDVRNDGQVLVEDAVIPGATLLGYVNADHWDTAISLERELPYLSARGSPREFPRDELLQAILLYVNESLALPDAPPP